MASLNPYIALVLCFTCLTCFSACQNDLTPDPNPSAPFTFQDGFETPGNNLNDLLPPNGSRWTAVQNESPSGTTNSIKLDETIFSEGSKSLGLLAQPNGASLPKIDIEKAGFSAPAGFAVIINAEFYISSEGSLADLFLLDLECCSCWDPTVENNQCPGVRLKFNEGDFLGIERGKILASTIGQSAVAFPRNQWVTVTWEMQLSPTDEGANVLKIDGETVIEATGNNLPNSDEFRAVFADNGIDFELQHPVAYERVQVGATANASSFQVEMNVDNFSIEARPLD